MSQCFWPSNRSDPEQQSWVTHDESWCLWVKHHDYGIFVRKFFIIGYFQCSWFLSNFSFLRIWNECALSGRRTRIWNYVNFSKSLKTVNVELISKVPAVRFCSSPLAILRILVPCDRKNWIKVFIRPNSNWNISSMMINLETSLRNKIPKLGITIIKLETQINFGTL